MYSQRLINQLTNECCNVIQEVFNELGINYQKSYKRFFGTCPIHNGDNPTAWSFYPEGEEVRGFWVCRTHHCEKKWKKNFVGFIHGVLSNQTGKEIPWTDAVKWMLNFLKYSSVEQVKIPTVYEATRQAQINALHRWNISPREAKNGWQREHVRKMIKLPADYYIKRGYKPETLDKYDVGFYLPQHRVLVPVYDAGYKFCVGFAGRTIWDKCIHCGYYHDQLDQCPSTIEAKMNASKWKNNRGFESANYLYNYWFARQSIMTTSTIILVEGPGDVWRLEEAGIHNSVAIFGVDLTEEQLTFIEYDWCMNVIVLFDTDEAGRLAAQTIKNKLSRTHRLYFPNIECKDVGELNTDQVTADIFPVIQQIKSFNQLILGDK